MGFGEPILWRLRNKEQTFLPNGHNRYAPADITVGELAELAKKELNAYLDNITAAKTLDHILQENQNTRNDERRENSSEKDYPAYGDGKPQKTALWELAFYQREACCNSIGRIRRNCSIR